MKVCRETWSAWKIVSRVRACWRKPSAALVHELVRRKLGLPPKQIVLDLDNLTVGRLLSEPPGLNPQEKMALRLIWRSSMREGKSLWRCYCPIQMLRLRLKAVAADLHSLQSDLQTAVLHLARHGRVDCAELTFLLDQDPALPWYLVLRALLQGHPAFQPS